MAMIKPAFRELVAALADEVEASGRYALYQPDYGAQQAHSIATSHAEHDMFAPVAGGMFHAGGQVFVEDWIEAQLLDCQNLARRHGFIKLSELLDEALDALLDERQGSEGAEAAWQAHSQQ